MYILRNSANLKVCDLIKEPTSCKTYGDNLNFFTSIFFDRIRLFWEMHLAE